jgi:hypothetical protein
MRIIGEKLNNQEMLAVKGGAEFTCACSDGTGAWTGNYDTTAAMLAAIEEYCYDIGQGGGGSCIAGAQQ